MKIYIAGSSSDLPRIRQWMGAVQTFSAGETAIAMAPGIDITHDWPSLIDKYGANPRTDYHQRYLWAAYDLAGVREADLLWVLMPPGISDGALFELGYANALGKDLVVSGPGHDRTIFTARACCYDEDESAFNYIVDCYNNEVADGHTEGK